MIIQTLIVTFILGVVPIINKYLVKSISIETLLLLSTFFLFIVSLLFNLFAPKNKDTIKEIMNFDKNKYIYLIAFITSIFVFIANYLYIFVLSKNTAYVVSAIIASNPIVTALIGYLLLNEKISIKGFFGMVAIIIGVIMLTL